MRKNKIPSNLIAWRVCACDCISFVMMLTFVVCAAIQNDISFRLCLIQFCNWLWASNASKQYIHFTEIEKKIDADINKPTNNDHIEKKKRKRKVKHSENRDYCKHNCNASWVETFKLGTVRVKKKIKWKISIRYAAMHNIVHNFNQMHIVLGDLNESRQREKNRSINCQSLSLVVIFYD